MAGFMFENWASDFLALLGESSLRASVLLAAAWAASRLLRKRSAALRHLIWTLSLGAVLAAPATLDLAPRLRLPSWAQPEARPAAPGVRAERSVRVAAPDTLRSPASPNRALPNRASSNRALSSPALSNRALSNRALSSRAGDTAAVPIAGPAEPLEIMTAAPRALPSRRPAPDRTLLPVLLVAVWALGFLVLVARLGIGHARVRQMARRAGSLNADFAYLEGRRPVRFLRSTGETMPMTWGWSQPFVMLPASFEKWDCERRTMTIWHELAHIERGDWLTQTLAQLVRAVYWFHPLAWLAFRRIRIEADRACDDIVLRTGAKPSGYAGHLVQSAREFRTAGLRPWVAIAMAHPSSLNHRVHYVLDETVERAALGRGRGLAWALAVALFVAAVPSIEAGGQSESRTASPQIDLQVAPPRIDLDVAVPRALDLTAEPVLGPVDQEVDVLLPRELMLLAQAQESATQNAEREAVRSADELEQRAVEALRREAARASREARLLAQRDRWAHGSRQPALSPQALQTAAAALRKALGSANADVRSQAAEALGQLGSPEQANLEALAKALGDEELRVRHHATESLGNLLSGSDVPPDVAVRWLTPALESTDTDIRRQAAESLGRLRGPEAITAVTRLVKDADPQVQREAIESLGQLLQDSDAQAARAALPMLRDLLGHDDPHVRRQLVETLGGLHSIAEEVVPLLAQAVEDPDPEVQRQAAEALGNISSHGFEGWFKGAVENDINHLNQSLEKLKRGYGSYGEI